AIVYDGICTARRYRPERYDSCHATLTSSNFVPVGSSETTSSTTARGPDRNQDSVASNADMCASSPHHRDISAAEHEVLPTSYTVDVGSAILRTLAAVHPPTEPPILGHQPRGPPLRPSLQYRLCTIPL
ncbi:hypothetical protein LTS18_000370, partial [Coniosporium uncinatum]